MSLFTRYVYVLRAVLLLAVLNSVLWNLFSTETQNMVTVVLFNTVRVALAFWAGWLIVAKHIGKLWGAAFGGALIQFVDHAIVSGAFFLGSGEIQSYTGILISYVMFVWIPMFAGWIGGFARLKLFSFNSYP